MFFFISCSILNNYLVWQTVRSLTSCLSKSFRDAYKGLRKALIGSEGREEQWRYCVNDANNVMGFAIGAMFVREVFHGKSKPMVRNAIICFSYIYFNKIFCEIFYKNSSNFFLGRRNDKRHKNGFYQEFKVFGLDGCRNSKIR